VRSAGEKVSHAGDTVVFECLSHQTSHSTSSQLRVDWLKDGQPIAASSKSAEPEASQTIAANHQSSLLKDSHIFTADAPLLQSRGQQIESVEPDRRRLYLVADSQILVLLSAQKSDAGVYTCVVRNAAGSRRAVTTLRVTGRPHASSHVDAGSDDTLTVRVGLAVIAAVCGVVLTSLAWVIVIYCLQRRQDLLTDTTSSTSTDETIVPPPLPAADVNTLDSLQQHVHLLPGII